jgi:hypothetical protein
MTLRNESKYGPIKNTWRGAMYRSSGLRRKPSLIHRGADDDDMTWKQGRTAGLAIARANISARGTSNKGDMSQRERFIIVFRVGVKPSGVLLRKSCKIVIEVGFGKMRGPSSSR